MPHHLQVAIRNLPHDFSRRAHYHRAVGDFLVGRNQRTRGDQAIAADAGAVEDCGAVCDQAAIVNEAGVHERAVTDRHVVAQVRRAAGVGMDDGAILDVGPVANNDPVRIRAQHAVEPYSGAAPQNDGANDLGTGGDIIILAHGLQLSVS